MQPTFASRMALNLAMLPLIPAPLPEGGGRSRLEWGEGDLVKTGGSRLRESSTEPSRPRALQSSPRPLGGEGAGGEGRRGEVHTTSAHVTDPRDAGPLQDTLHRHLAKVILQVLSARRPRASPHSMLCQERQLASNAATTWRLCHRLEARLSADRGRHARTLM